MFTELRLARFKSFRDRQFAQLAPLTLIYGPNSGGKSSIIQSLLLIKQSLARSRSSPNILDFNGQFIDLGSYRNVLYRHEPANIDIGFSFETAFLRRDQASLLPPDRAPRSVDFSFSQTPEQSPMREKSKQRRYVGLESCSYRVGTEEQRSLDIQLQNANGYARERGLRFNRDRELHFYRISDEAGIRNLAKYILSKFGEQLAQLDRSTDSMQAIRTVTTHARDAALRRLLNDTLFATPEFLPASPYRAISARESSAMAISDDAIEEQNLAERYGIRLDFLSRFAEEVRHLFAQISYIGPFRRPPERIEVIRDRATNSVGSQGEYFHYLLNAQSRSTQKLNDWLDRMHVPYRVELASAQMSNQATVGRIVQVRYHDNRFETVVSAADIGYGIGQIIPIIVEGFTARNRVILVEQPEVHLHPKLQADVADMFLSTMYSDKNPNGNQWIIETHSELILLRLLRRVRSGDLEARNVRILYVDPPSTPNLSSCGSSIFDLELAPDGRFRVPWPEGFFDEQSAEIFAGP